RRTHLFELVHHNAFGTHGFRHAGKAGAFQFACNKPAVVEVDLVLLLGAPLAVVEYHSRNRDVVAHAREDLDHAHGPGAVTGVGDGGTIRSSNLGTNDGGQRVATVAPAHGREHAAGTLETQIAVGHRVDVADVGRHHDIFGHGFFQLAQHLAGVQVVAG